MSVSSEKLKWYEFIAKYIVILGSAGWVLLVGTDFIQKKVSEVQYRNLKLGKSSIPIAKQSLNVKKDNDPWIGDESLCTVSGKYTIKNKGVLPFQVDSVLLEVYETPVLTAAKAKEKKITSLTTTNLLQKHEPLLVEEIAEPSRVGADGEYSNTFLFVINRSRGMNYTFVANASGTVIGVNNKRESHLIFGENELKIYDGPSMICGGDSTLPQGV